MLRIRRELIRQGPIEWAGRSVTLVAEQWTAWAASPWFAGAATYCRPVRVEGDEPGAEPVPIRDHVMLVRLAALLVAVAVFVERRLFR